MKDKLVRYKKVVIPIRSDSGWRESDYQTESIESIIERTGDVPDKRVMFDRWCWLLNSLAPGFVEELTRRLEKTITPQVSVRIAVDRVIEDGWASTMTDLDERHEHSERFIWAVFDSVAQGATSARAAVESILEEMHR